MRNNFLATTSKKASTVYHAVDEGEEEEEESSWRSQREELRDDDLPDSHYENYPPPEPQEANKEQYDHDPRRSTVSPRVKLLLNREFVFQSSKMTYYNPHEMRLASPRPELPVEVQSRLPTFLRPPSFAEVPREESEDPDEAQDVIHAPKVVPDVQVPKVMPQVTVSKLVPEVQIEKVKSDVQVPHVVQEVKVQPPKEVQDVSDTMSVTSLFYDDYSTEHTSTGVEVDLLHEQDDATAYSAGLSIFSRSRPVVIDKTTSVETSFPEDPNKWLDASSVVGDEHLVTSATFKSRDVDPTPVEEDDDDDDSFLAAIVTPTGSKEDSHHSQQMLQEPQQNHEQQQNQTVPVWQPHNHSETLTETDSVFDKSKHTGRSQCSPFDDLNENEVDTDEQDNDVAMDQLFPSDPLWTIRCEMEKQELATNTNSNYVVGQSYGDTEEAFHKDPFYVQSTNENVHSFHDSNSAVSSPKSKDQVSTGKASVAEFQAPIMSFVDVGKMNTGKTRVDGNQNRKETRPVERNDVVGPNYPFDSLAFNPFAGTQDEEDDDYSRYEESNALGHNSNHETLPAQKDSNPSATRAQRPLQVTNPFESYDDPSLLDILNKSRDTIDSDDPIMETDKAVVANYVNPFDDLSINGSIDSSAANGGVSSYVNPFDDGSRIGENKPTAGKSINPFDTFDDDKSLDRTANLPSDSVKTRQLVTRADDDNRKQVVDRTPQKQDHEKSPPRSVRKATKGTNLYTLVMMSSGPKAKDSKTKQLLQDSKGVPPEDAVDSTDKSNKEQKTTGNNNSKRNQNRTVLPPPSDNDNTLAVDDIFNQALLPPSTQGGPLEDSDDDDCYIEDDDDNHNHHGGDNDSDLSDNSDDYEGGEDTAMYDDEAAGGPWPSSLYPSESSDTRGNNLSSVQCGTTMDSTDNDVPAPAQDGPKQLPVVKKPIAVTRRQPVDLDEVSIESDRDAYDAFMRDTGKHHNDYDSTVSMEESDQQTCFGEEAHPDSEALSCYDEVDDDDAQTYGDDGTVSGLKVLGCLHCSALEEEMMILKAQHQTELLERDLQDEEVLNNMMLMREYIEHLESDQSVIRLSQAEFAESRSRCNSVVEIEIQPSLSEISKDLEEKSPNFQLFELKARVRFLEDENQRLKDEQADTIANSDTLALMVRIRELENECEENKKVKAVNDQLKSRIQELENQLETTKHEKDKELQQRIQELEEKLDLAQQETREDLKHQIDELTEERDLLCTKIEAQEASVALMTQEEEELKKQIQRLENELQLVKLEKESEKVESLFPMELTATLLSTEL